MTTKRDKTKDESEAERPKLKKEKLRDLDTKHLSEGVMGGRAGSTRCIVGNDDGAQT